MHTKADLRRYFKLSHSTVYRTLKACGLSTSKRCYTDKELQDYFVPARTLFDSGYTLHEVQEYFAMKQTHMETPLSITES